MELIGGYIYIYGCITIRQGYPGVMFSTIRGPCWGGPKNKDYGMLESVLGSPICEVRGMWQEEEER